LHSSQVGSVKGLNIQVWDEADIAPCPFCGGLEIEIGRGTEDKEGFPTWAYCATCGAQGPWKYLGENAPRYVKLTCIETGWNTRSGARYSDLRR
jgi:Lar family restriction alleviation protein